MGSPYRIPRLTRRSSAATGTPAPSRPGHPTLGRWRIRRRRRAPSVDLRPGRVMWPRFAMVRSGVPRMRFSKKGPRATTTTRARWAMLATGRATASRALPWFARRRTNATSPGRAAQPPAARIRCSLPVPAATMGRLHPDGHLSGGRVRWIESRRLRAAAPMLCGGHLQLGDGRVLEPDPDQRRRLQRWERLHPDGHLSGGRVRWIESRRLRAAAPMLCGGHLQLGDGRVLEPDPDQWRRLQRRQCVHPKRPVHQRRLLRHSLHLHRGRLPSELDVQRERRVHHRQRGPRHLLPGRR